MDAVAWALSGDEWRLMWGRRSVASVWTNGTWHTWDRVSTGGENASEPTVERAKREALAALVRQNLNPCRGWARHSARCARAIELECARHLAIEAGDSTYYEGRVLKAAAEWLENPCGYLTDSLRGAVSEMQKRRKP